MARLTRTASKQAKFVLLSFLYLVFVSFHITTETNYLMSIHNLAKSE